MDGEQDGAQAQQQVEGQPKDGQSSQQGDGQGQQPKQEPSAQLQVGPTGDARPEEYEAQLRAKDARIAELSAKVADAAKSQKAADDLGRQIAELKRQMEDERTDFALRSAGCRSTKAAKALLADHGGDVAKLREAEPWLFSDGAAESGTTGLEPAGASGGYAEKERLKHWRELAGLSGDDEGEE
jgi:hypothetical protein